MSKYIHTEVDGIKLKLSNLSKILYPESGITKAEVIQYYMTIAPIIINHIGNRPLTLIRYPDGIEKNKFYSKSCPEWAPSWIKRQEIQHSEEMIPYAVINNTAGVVWLANLAALEIHPMQMLTTKMENPDHFIFDIDPPEGADFSDVKQIAYKLKRFLESYNYTPFIKTSGSKGVHIIVPIITQHTHDEMVECVKGLAKLFVQQNKDSSTLNLQKNNRDGKTLIDIYRNHMAQTTVSAYSLRAKPNASISTPITWDQLENLKHSTEINIRNIDAHLEKYGDVWKDIRKSAVPLHTHHQAIREINKEVEKKLESYLHKRDFGKTPEPRPQLNLTNQNRFSVQLHNASNLHYDLRLEDQGVLLSWAIPKGLPHRKGIKRLAIQTEDHPMEYLDFEGVIPKGEYGAGEMWVFAKGQVSWIKKTDSSHEFILDSKQLKGHFKLYKTKGEQWLIERKNEADATLLNSSIKPQLADVSKIIPSGIQYSFEIKWDGIRSLIHVLDDQVKIYSRSGREISNQFPELQIASEAFHIENGIFDGEIISMDKEGRPIFSDVISRLHTKGERSIQSAVHKNPVYCYLFDCLFLDGRNICNEPLKKRQDWLAVSLKKNNQFRLSETMSDGKALFDAAKNMNLEGIMAKDLTKPYEVGNRNNYWLKIKFRDTISVQILGYTRGNGDRSNLFGALHIATENNGSWNYLGKVGTGFDEAKMIEVLAILKAQDESKKLITENIEEAHRTIWITPKLWCEVQYASLTNKGTLREPVFLGLRPDLES